MPRATTSPTAGASPIQSSTPSIEDVPPVPVQPSNDDQQIPPQLPAPSIRKPPNALNLSQRRGRRKKSIMSMPRVLPSPTVPLLHRIPGSINFPRLAGSPTPPSFSSSSASDDDDARSSPLPRSASRRSFPADWDATARHRLLGRRDSDDYGGGTTLRRRTFDDKTADADADDWRWDHGTTGKRQLPYVDSLPRDAVTRSLLSMSTSRPGRLSRSRSRLSRSRSMPNSDTDDDEVWC